MPVHMIVDKPVHTIREGQVWREKDKRMDRLVRVVSVGKHTICIVTILDDGSRKPGCRVSQAARTRFGKAGGYSYVREGVA